MNVVERLKTTSCFQNAVVVVYRTQCGSIVKNLLTGGTTGRYDASPRVEPLCAHQKFYILIIYLRACEPTSYRITLFSAHVKTVEY